MKPWLLMSRAELRDQQPRGATEVVHFTESLAEAVIEEYSKPGEVVLDPFAGFGTTARVAARMGRRAVAVEILPERASLIREHLRGSAEVITGDARDLGSLVGGPVDLCLTSPPYMTATGHPQNPLTGYTTADGDYQTYLTELAAVFGDVARLLRAGGRAVINAANPVTDGTITPLAWDIGQRVSEHLPLRQEVFLCWDRQPPGISGDYCLVFQKAGSPPTSADHWDGARWRNIPLGPGLAHAWAGVNRPDCQCRRLDRGFGHRRPDRQG